MTHPAVKTLKLTNSFKRLYSLLIAAIMDSDPPAIQAALVHAAPFRQPQRITRRVRVGRLPGCEP